MLNVEIFNMSNIDTTHINFDKSYMMFDSNTNNIIIKFFLDFFCISFNLSFSSFVNFIILVIKIIKILFSYIINF